MSVSPPDHLHLEDSAVQPTAEAPWPRAWPESVTLAPFPALRLTEPLVARLRLLRDHQMKEHLAGRPQMVCGVFYEEEVVCLHVFCGHATYLGTDGRVHYQNFNEGK